MSHAPIVSVYGSSKPQPGTDTYQMAETLGQLLAKAGFTVMTGGYGGTMEATSKGAKQVGGQVIGVTASLFEERLGREGPNPYVDEIIRYPTLEARVNHLVKECHAIVALPGGVGTLSEITLAWSYIQTGEMNQKPLIIIGKKWQEVIEMVYDSRYIDEQSMRLIQFASTPQDALAILKNGIPE